MKDKTSDLNDLSAIKNEAWREPVVVMYGCTPQGDRWPDYGLPRVEKDDLPVLPKQKVDVNIDKVQEIVSAIKRNKEKLYDLENLLLSPNDTIIVESFDNVNHERIFDIPYDTEVAKGIIELIKSYYENEIERLNEELITVVVG